VPSRRRPAIAAAWRTPLEAAAPLPDRSVSRAAMNCRVPRRLNCHRPCQSARSEVGLSKRGRPTPLTSGWSQQAIGTVPMRRRRRTLRNAPYGLSSMPREADRQPLSRTQRHVHPTVAPRRDHQPSSRPEGTRRSPERTAKEGARRPERQRRSPLLDPQEKAEPAGMLGWGPKPFPGISRPLARPGHPRGDALTRVSS
jgi:hypothetical protein